jgi:AraC-like DNA-binding protein
MTQRTRLLPRRRLASFVRSTVVVSNRIDGTRYTRLPNGEVELVVRITDNTVLAHVLGARTVAVSKPVERDVARALLVRFHPGGAYPFFGVPISELTDRAVSLDTLWGADGERLRDSLIATASDAAAVDLLESALVAQLTRATLFEPASASMVRRAVARISQATEPPRIEDLARSMHVSARNLRRAFHDVVGLGPKAFARIVRFQRALHAAREGTDIDWSDIARNAGYYDQSHLIADFRAFAGTTPHAMQRPEIVSGLLNVD